MKVKHNTFYPITTYEAESEVAIEKRIRNIDNSNIKIFVYSWLQIKNSPG